jgi:stage V sporulation protein SpoVS
MRARVIYDEWKRLLRQEAADPNSLLIERLCQKLGPTQTAVLTSLILHDTEQAAFAAWGSENRELWNKAVYSLREYVTFTPHGVDLSQLFTKINLQGEERSVVEQVQLEAQIFPQANHAVAHVYFRVTGMKVNPGEWAIIGKMLQHCSRQLINLVLQRCWMGQQTLRELLPLVVHSRGIEDTIQQAASQGALSGREQYERFMAVLNGGTIPLDPITQDILDQLRGDK